MHGSKTSEILLPQIRIEKQADNIGRLHMNQLNEKLRIIRTQIMAEGGQVHPDMERLNELYIEEERCLNEMFR